MKLHELKEALKPSQYRKYVKGWDKSRYEKIFKKYTDDKKAYRIYLPLKGVKTPVKEPLDLMNVLLNHDYEIEDYVLGLASKVGERHRVVKIGKILQKLIDNKSSSEAARAKHQQILKNFNEDPKRKNAATQDYLVVISRHPYDLAGMSTDRGWKSCMNLDDGMFRSYVGHDVKKGTIIAYLVKTDDPDIKHPVARVLIKPFFKIDDPKEVAFGIENRVYGTNVNGFTDAVEKWVEEVNDSQNLSGLFQLNKDLYNDGIEKFKHISKGKNKIKVGAVLNVDEAIFSVDDYDPRLDPHPSEPKMIQVKVVEISSVGWVHVTRIVNGKPSEKGKDTIQVDIDELSSFIMEK